MQWHALEIKEVFEKLGSSQDGLSFKQAEKRLQAFGPNKLPEPKRLSRAHLFLKQFHNSLVYILLAIIIISFLSKHYIDASFILLVVIINGLVSFIQEDKAENALSALGKALKTKARIIRDAQEQEISAQELVPGDIIILRAGDQVPADARLIKANNLKANEASLTGEFWAVKKITQKLSPDLAVADRQNLVYLGTTIEQGQAKAVVIATGKHTQMGSLALTVKEIPSIKSPLQKNILEFSRILALVIIIAAILIFLIGLLKGQFLFMTAVALVVSAIPEGLLPVITVVLVIGMRRILKKKGLVRKLIAAESLGSATVLCVDKTGTLTTGQMTVVDLIAEDQNMAWQIIARCNEAILTDSKMIGRPTDKALLSAGLQAGFAQDLEERKALLPFDAEKKYLAALYANYLYVAGAPESLLEMSKLSQDEKDAWQFRIKKIAGQGLRVISLAYKKADNIKDLQDLIFIGLAVLKDPLRPDTKKAINICQQAGIQVVMVTGDHKLTAKNIAQELDFDVSIDSIVDGSKFSVENIRQINVFSRVTPEQKLEIVQAWQEQGEVVAMTGDGVNDVPALKKADIGIALASGTDVAKQVADLVLLKNSFKTIVVAIEQGRIIFENIKKVILYLLSTSIAEVILIMFSLLFGLPLPLIPVQILWINIVEDTFPDFALALEPGEKQVMQGRVKNRKILDSPIKRLMLIIGLVTVLASFGLFVVLWKFLSFDLTKVRTMIFTVNAMGSMLFVFSCRSLHRTILRRDIFANRYLVLAVLGGILLLLAAIYLPWLQFILRTTSLTGLDWSIVIATSIIGIVLIELFKYKFVIKKYAQRS